MAEHRSHEDRSIALMARDKRAAKVESTLQKALTPLYTVSEVAEYLQVSPSTVYRMIQDRRLSGVRVGHGIRFTPDNLAQMIEENALEAW